MLGLHYLEMALVLAWVQNVNLLYNALRQYGNVECTGIISLRSFKQHIRFLLDYAAAKVVALDSPPP